MVNILVISILIIPWLILPFNNLPDCTRLIKSAFFDLTMLGIIVMALKNGLRFEYKNKYLAYLAGWIFFTFIFNWYYPILRGIGYNASTVDSMIHIILAIVATILVCSNLERIDFVRCAKAMCISATLVSIFCIFQGIGLDPMKHVAKYGWKETRHIAALLDNPDVVGNYLCMSLGLFVYFGKPKYYVCLALCLIALLLTHSSISIVSGFIGIFVYCFFKFYRSRIALIFMSLALILFLGFCIASPSFNKLSGGFTGRVDAWKMIVNKLNNPLFGQGLGIVKELNIVTGTTTLEHLEVVQGKFVANVWQFSHNDYLEIYASLGALGLFLLILIIIHTFRRFNYKEDNQIGFAYYGCFISFLIVMFGSFPMEMAPIALNGLVFYWALNRT